MFCECASSPTQQADPAPGQSPGSEECILTLAGDEEVLVAALRVLQEQLTQDAVYRGFAHVDYAKSSDPRALPENKHGESAGT